MTKRKKVGRVMLIILASILAVLIALFCLLFAWSPGKIAPYRDDNGGVLAGSVAEIVRTEIGGISQGLIIKGKSDRNPVLLFLHGGPGNPEYVLAKNYDIGLEDYFTVCWWDQRGSGMSYIESGQPETWTLERMADDTVEVTNYLRERFGADKIYLMGHSWGSFLGVNVVSQNPELYEAYIGIGQVTNQLESEKLAYDYMLKTLSEKGESTKEFEKYDLSGENADLPAAYFMLRSQTLSKLGNGVFHAPQAQFKEILLPFLQAREYTLADKYGYLMGSLKSLEAPVNNELMVDLSASVFTLDVPVYIFHGAYDMQVNYELSKRYFELLDAPEKHFYSFDNSAHSPFMEEPARFIEIVKRDVLGLE
ncbi:MAG: alpha/beta hydrolase [Oscillospiraceae bacterium]|jgi:pimeloyl-ACP methyl ester carboxylesterase|nr:alpha/beta hydrolase [Oscillospiraceae bacterium]